MKAASLLAALWQIGIAFAHGEHDHGILHGLMKKDGYESPAAESGTDGCTCVTNVVTWYGDATLIQPSSTSRHTSTTTQTSTHYSTVTLFETKNSPAPYTSFSATGVYTIPATTITLTSTVVVPCPTTSSSDTYAPGTYIRPETTLTVTETNSVYVCPFTPVSSPASETAAPPVHSETPAPPAQAPEPAHTPAPSTEAPAPAPASPKGDEPSPSKSTSSASASPSSSSGGSGSSPISSNGDQWGMTYSPYTAQGGCKDAGAVSADISSIKAAGFTTVRLYSTDCSGLEHVGNACKENNLKLVLGVFIDSKGIDAARPQVEDIISWGQGNWEMVELIVIGNEALFNRYCDAGALVSFIAETKAQIKGAGYGGLFTTTETTNILQEFGSLFCDVVDVLGANIHPFFNSEVSPDQAGSFTASQIELVGKICPGKEVYNLESGWPHGGQANGKATPGPEHQKTAIASIQEKVGAKTCFFSFEDDLWKHDGQFGVEQKWGCNDLFKG